MIKLLTKKPLIDLPCVGYKRKERKRRKEKTRKERRKKRKKKKKTEKGKSVTLISTARWIYKRPFLSVTSAIPVN